MNIDYRKVILAFVAAVIISVPTATAFQNRTNQIEAERQQNSRLQLDIKKKNSELEKFKIQTEEQRKKDEAEKQKLREQNEQLQKDLQAKRERKAEEARLAAAQASKPAAVQPKPQTSYVATGGGCDSYRGMVAQYDWDVNTMMRIMNAESSCIPTKHNHADNHRVCLGSYGLFQVGCVHGYSMAHLESPANNIAAAYKIFKSQGYTAWTTY